MGNLSQQINSETIIYALHEKFGVFFHLECVAHWFLKKRKHYYYRAFICSIPYLRPDNKQIEHTIRTQMTRNWPEIFYAIKKEQARIPQLVK